MGDPGCLSLYGSDPDRNRLFAEHLAAEYRLRTSGRGREVDEWRLCPESFDNHWFDGVVGCAVAAWMQGAVLAGTSESRAPVVRGRVKLSEMRRMRMGR